MPLCCRNGLAAPRRIERAALARTPRPLSRGVGLPAPTVSGVERGVRNPTVVILGQLARALRVEPAVLLERKARKVTDSRLHMNIAVVKDRTWVA